MATLAVDFDATRLPQTRGGTGTATARIQRRTWTVWLTLCAIGLAPHVLGLSPALKAAGLGLWLPGGGFLALGGWWSLLFPLTLVLFVASLVAWFWAGAVIAPLIVWGGAALLAGSLAGESTWNGGPYAAATAVAAIGLSFRARNRKAALAGAERALAREAFLPKALAEVARQQRDVPCEASRELTPDQLAGLRYLLDRTLQPVASFDGFTIIDQFQPAALRYQINHMGFALAIAQANYVPNFRGYMGQAQRNLIEKYLEKKVWYYWVLESCWGHFNFTDWDPAKRDNIMLTGWFGAHVGGYMLASGDRRYLEPGSLTFRLNARKEWRHDFRSIIGSVERNYASAEFGQFACEPNWIYPICNHYGMLSLQAHDALLGTDLIGRHLPAWLKGLETEFTDASGSTVGLRSQYTGLPVPFPVGEAGYSFFESAFLPQRARQQWAIARTEIEPLLVEDEGGKLRMAMPGEGLDAGNYRAGHAGAYGTYLVAAREFGDERLAAAALAGLEHDCMPARDDGVLRYRKASNISNATAIMGSLMRTGDFARTFSHGASKRALAGPMIETAAYPEVLVARAWSDGAALDAVFYPGRDEGVQTIPLSQLEPGRTYRLSGATTDSLVADAQGTARFAVNLSGRTEVRLEPA
ncbi:hypothetical protein [Novosphingobium sp.]|uniref:linalool dehydratase/isomerase domain-containing protein n=1 Tax=Novosphingobium sp. TaxID=1874826 RepID=UPI0035B26482